MPGDIIILHMCTKNHDQMMEPNSWDMVCDGWTDRRMDEQMDGLTDRGTDRRMDRQTDRQTDKKSDI